MRCATVGCEREGSNTPPSNAASDVEDERAASGGRLVVPPERHTRSPHPPAGSTMYPLEHRRSSANEVSGGVAADGVFEGKAPMSRAPVVVSAVAVSLSFGYHMTDIFKSYLICRHPLFVSQTHCPRVLSPPIPPDPTYSLRARRAPYFWSETDLRLRPFISSPSSSRSSDPARPSSSRRRLFPPSGERKRAGNEPRRRRLVSLPLSIAIVPFHLPLPL